MCFQFHSPFCSGDLSWTPTPHCSAWEPAQSLCALGLSVPPHVRCKLTRSRGGPALEMGAEVADQRPLPHDTRGDGWAVPAHRGRSEAGGGACLPGMGQSGSPCSPLRLSPKSTHTETPAHRPRMLTEGPGGDRWVGTWGCCGRLRGRGSGPCRALGLVQDFSRTHPGCGLKAERKCKRFSPSSIYGARHAGALSLGAHGPGAGGRAGRPDWQLTGGRCPSADGRGTSLSGQNPGRLISGLLTGKGGIYKG